MFYNKYVANNINTSYSYIILVELLFLDPLLKSTMKNIIYIALKLLLKLRFLYGVPFVPKPAQVQTFLNGKEH